MQDRQLETIVEAAWEARDQITPTSKGEAREAIESTLNALDSGKLRVAERQADGQWRVNQWAKKAVLLGFRLKDMEQQPGGPQGGGRRVRAAVLLSRKPRLVSLVGDQGSLACSADRGHRGRHRADAEPVFARLKARHGR